MAYPFVAGNYPHASYIPHKYSPKLLQKFYDATMLTRVTNSDYVGDFMQGGDQITIRKRPEIATFKYQIGQAIPYTDLQTEDMTVKVERMRGYAFKVNNIEQRLTDLKGFVNEWTDEGAKRLAIDIETEFFKDIYSKCDTTHNAGATAGVRSASYNLGQDSAANAVAITASNVVDKIIDCNAVLNEQPGGCQPGAFIIIPVWMAAMLKKSDLHKADMMGDTRTSLRTDVCAIGNVGGFDIYQSNLLNIHQDSATNITPVIFGTRDAITFAKTISITEVKDNPFEPGKLHSSIMVYDWFSTHPEHFGVMFCKQGS